MNTPQSPVVVNVADFLKQIQQNRPPAQNVVIGGQGAAIQHNSVSLLGGFIYSCDDKPGKYKLQLQS